MPFRESYILPSEPSELGLRAARDAQTAGINQLEIANHLGINQSQVSRIFRGKVRRHTDTLMRVCRYVSSRSLKISPEEVRKNDLLIEAVADVWDGTESDAQALARVIRSLQTLRRPTHNRE